MGLSETYDEDQLFSFDFSQNIRVPRLPEFADWAQQTRDNPAISFDEGLCQSLVQEVGPHLEGQIPVSRGQGFWGWVGAAFGTSLIHTQNCSLTPAPPSGALGLPRPLGFLPATGCTGLCGVRRQGPRLGRPRVC